MGRAAGAGHRARDRGRLGLLRRAGQHADCRSAVGRRGQGLAVDAELVYGDAGRGGLLRRLP